MVGSTVLSELEAIIGQEPIDEVFIALPREKYGYLIEAIVHLCEEQGIIVRVQADMFKLEIARWHVDELDGMPIVTIRSGPPDDWQLLFKRALDFCGSLVLLLLMAPVF